MMTIEKITQSKTGGFFAMLVTDGKFNEMFFETEAEALAYVAAFNKFFA